MTCLRHAREALGLRPAQVATILGVSPSTVLNWEYGIARPRPATMTRLVQLYGTAEETLTGLKPARRESALSTRPVLRAAREAAGLTILALAYKARMHPYTVRAWENGTACPRRHSMDCIASVLGVEPITVDPTCWRLRTSHEGDNKVGAILRQLRYAKGFSQNDVAEAIGVTQGAVAHWENGRTAPSPRLIGRLAAALGVTSLPLPMNAAESHGDEMSIVAFRRRAGLSQHDVARLIGVSQAAVGHWETGKRRPRAKSLDALTALFNVSADDLKQRNVDAAQALQNHAIATDNPAASRELGEGQSC